MEATIVNLLEPGETVLIACNGYWGDRLTNVAERQGVKIHRVEGEWGAAIPPETLIKEIEAIKPTAVFVTHGESSTGVCQPLDGIGEVCRKNNSLFIVDSVVTLAGMPLFTDDWKIDVVYSGAQKCLSCPPGVSPISFGPRAIEKISSRKTPVASFYLDALELGKYWGQERVYHHTGSINSVYALREALAIVSEKGLENSWDQHSKVAAALYQGLEDLGLELLVKNPKERLLPLTTVKIPAGVDGKAVQSELMTKYNLEIAGGLGQLAGKVWRIGLMGHNARLENVALVLSALKAVLKIPAK
jgi:alanine-glyoxylate transaminase/serine-glyoxylate transaminase/serine-pyruvate transaminase